MTMVGYDGVDEEEDENGCDYDNSCEGDQCEVIDKI